MAWKWKHFDTWFAKLIGGILIIGAIWWMAFSIRWHYHTNQPKWEYLPFIASGFAIMFGLAMLSKKATEGAASVILPFATLVIEKLGRRKEDSAAVIVHPAPGANVTAEQVAVEIKDKLTDKHTEPMPGEGKDN